MTIELAPEAPETTDSQEAQAVPEVPVVTAPVPVETLKAVEQIASLSYVTERERIANWCTSVTQTVGDIPDVKDRQLLAHLADASNTISHALNTLRERISTTH
jgi:hypothetical protein